MEKPTVGKKERKKTSEAGKEFDFRTIEVLLTARQRQLLATASSNNESF